MTEFRRYSPRSMEAPEPPCAIACAGVAKPRTRSNGPSVSPTGRSEFGCASSA